MHDHSEPATVDEILSHTAWVRRLASALARDPNEADDLVQETWLRSMRSPPRLGVPLRAWLARLLRNTAKNRRRSEARRRSHEQGSAPAPDVAAPPVDAVLARSELQAALVHEVQQLDGGSRAVVVLRWFEGLPPRVIARRLGIPVETVRKRLQRAHEKLRAKLAARCGEDWRGACLALAAGPQGAGGLAGLGAYLAAHRLALAALALLLTAGLWRVWSVGRDDAGGDVAPRTAVRGAAIAPEGRDAPRPEPGGTGERHARDGARDVAPPAPARTPVEDERSEPRTPEPAAGGAAVAPGLAELRRLAREWFAAWLALERAPARHAALERDAERAKERFHAAWNAVVATRDLLASQADLRAVFRDAFPYEKRAKTGRARRETVEGGSGAYALFVPESYDPERAYGTVLALPELARDPKRSRPAEAETYAKRVWQRHAAELDLIVVVPRLGWFSDGDRRADAWFARTVLDPARDVERSFRVDRDRVVLDCGVGTSRLGLRLASLDPDRFAGVILRQPELDEALRLDGLHGLPLLLLRSPETRDACERIRARLGDAVDVVDGRAHAGSPLDGAIAAWAAARKRDLMRKTVVLAPNDDVHRTAYWVGIDALDASGTPPFVRAEADREANRIILETAGVRALSLRLNHALVDPTGFTLVVDGTSTTVTVMPELDVLTREMFASFDTSRTFTALHHVTVRD